MLGEIAFQGAFDKIMWMYTYKYTKEGKNKTVSFESVADDYSKFEYDDYMADMHASALKFVHKIASTDNI